MSLLARSVATLEGIALTADPNYQMVAQVGIAWGLQYDARSGRACGAGGGGSGVSGVSQRAVATSGRNLVLV